MKHTIFAGVVLASLTSGAQADFLADVTAKEAAVAKLRQEVTTMATPILVKGADLRTFVSLSPLVEAVSKLNERPVEGRTINVMSTSMNGHIWYDGGDWCGSFVELNSPDAMRATAVMSNFSATPIDGGVIRMGAHIAVVGKLQAKVHVMGRRARFLIGNVCPPGGGAGTSVGVGFNKNENLLIDLSFTPSADGRSLNYTAAFVKPDQLKVTAEIGLGVIGTLGHPMEFDLPKTPLASGSTPLLLTNEGTFQIPGEKTARAYSLVLTPSTFSVNSAGVLAAWKTTVQFKSKPAGAAQ